MTVKEVLPMLFCPEEVKLACNGSVINFNFESDIEVNVWGNFVVAYIAAMKDGAFELTLAAQPIVKEAVG